MEDEPRSVTAEDASRAFTDILSRVEAEGAPVEIVRDGKVVARLVPVMGKVKTLGELIEAMKTWPKLEPGDGDDWIREIEELRRQSPMPPSPWD
jgi:prevent-host-death family protein